jgi:hypothetical protein
MSKFIDLTGQRFGRLIVKEFAGMDKRGHCSCWICVCDCGNIKSVSSSNLKNRSTKLVIEV